MPKMTEEQQDDFVSNQIEILLENGWEEEEAIEEAYNRLKIVMED